MISTCDEKECSENRRKKCEPEKTPKADTTRNGEVADTMNAAAVVMDVKNIAIAERLYTDEKNRAIHSLSVCHTYKNPPH